MAKNVYILTDEEVAVIGEALDIMTKMLGTVARQHLETLKVYGKQLSSEEWEEIKKKHTRASQKAFAAFLMKKSLKVDKALERMEHA